MGYKTALSKDDKDWIDTEIDDLVRDRATISVSEVTRDLVDRIESAAEGGSGDAVRLMRSLAQDGVQSRVSSRIKNEHGTVRVSTTGKVVSLPARVGSRAQDTDGVKLRVFQQTLWYELTWDAFIEMVTERRRQIAQLGDKVVGFEQVLPLRDQFPDTLTPGEALERAGIDPNSIDLEMTA